MQDTDHVALDDNDFVILVRPDMSGDSWTGRIELAIVTSGDNNLDDESYGQLTHLGKMMCSTVPLMELDKNMRDKVHDYAMAIGDDEDSDDAPQVTAEYEGNVIRLTFNSQTGGSA